MKVVTCISKVVRYKHLQCAFCTCYSYSQDKIVHLIQLHSWYNMASIIGGKRGKVLILNGFRYQKNKETASAIYWRCWRKECGSMAKTNYFDVNGEAPAIRVINESLHPHPEDTEQIRKDETIDRLKRAVREDPSRPIKRAFEGLAHGHQGGGDREQLPEFHTVRTLMQRTRSALVPPVPRVIADVRIDGEWSNTWSHERFLLDLDNDWGVALFATDENLQRLQRCQDVYMDGTFRTCPKPYKQFFTIHGKYMGRVIPFVFVLLTGKTTGHYRQMLQIIKREIRQKVGHRWRPNRIICDFEQSIITAVETELPIAHVTCCYFHFCQSLYRRLNELGLSDTYKENVQFKRCIRRFLSMGFLPLAIVRQNFHQFAAEHSTQRLVRRYPGLRDFILYLDRNYFDGNFPPVTWNVYDREGDTRTNNYVEGELI